ncbi:NAD(P)H-binding protein [Bradyrhizobium sp. Pear77]|uniref:NAD(P)H-binding protein n=1 Tax=Bradyrhizobium altum TaxID=1571202 RepID=UPI001E2D3155|nr:NAD(P)H-binding protein [Bradyrhizobium altum]MCC8952873.1 NAD(P)H-binding protein [Bradyrhizobium altum]
MIVVTTPNGQIGSKVVSALLEAGQAVRVILRDPAKLAANVRERVEVIEGSHGDAETIDRALDGADALFWCVPPSPRSTMEESIRALLGRRQTRSRATGPRMSSQ